MNLNNIRKKATLHYLRHNLTEGRKCQGLPVWKLLLFSSFQIQGFLSVSQDDHERITQTPLIVGVSEVDELSWLA